MSDETTELLRLLEEREVNQESIVRSFLRKISPNRDWDYLGEHEHALIAALISDIVATLGSEREKELEELVRDMNAALIHDNCYRWCEAKEPCNLITDGKCQYRERIRELGIEVVTDER